MNRVCNHRFCLVDVCVVHEKNHTCCNSLSVDDRTKRDNPCTRTQANFKSTNPNFTNCEDIYECVGESLRNQRDLCLRITPWEQNLWEDDELENFEVDVELVDRLYYIDHFSMLNPLCPKFCNLGCRMVYNGKHIYIKMRANCSYDSWRGDIFVSKDVNLFLKQAKLTTYEWDGTLDSLAGDSIVVEEQTMYDVYSREAWISPPTLRYLCNRSIYDNDIRREQYSSVLPQLLTSDVDHFIKMKEKIGIYVYHRKIINTCDIL